ncbi:ferritin [Treponema pectinovorum]|uniref:ferritin n=1 Tax=Treponema pectinovorum TaxID=164 RepID=UPI0021C2A190|nr:ferritin [Treponema pectinovorum]
MDKEVSKLLNEQINKEMYSAYLYLSMANFYEEKGLTGFANWFEIQAKEEMDHAMMFYSYMHNNEQKVSLESIAKPDKVFNNLGDPLKEALAHEKYVTALINKIYDAALKANDHRTTQFLAWFIEEQGEEEKNASDLITKMSLFGESSHGLYLLNSELKNRKYSKPSVEE